jgi:hypothetical protein
MWLTILIWENWHNICGLVILRFALKSFARVYLLVTISTFLFTLRPGKISTHGSCILFAISSEGHICIYFLFAFSAVILGVHTVLMQLQPNIVTIIVPRHPQHGREIAKVSFWFHILSFQNMSVISYNCF